MKRAKNGLSGSLVRLIMFGASWVSDGVNFLRLLGMATHMRSDKRDRLIAVAVSRCMITVWANYRCCISRSGGD